MRVDAGSNYMIAAQRGSASSRANVQSFATSAETTPRTSSAGNRSSQQPDFTNTTRQEVFDWMNGQIRGGNMSLDDSLPFLGMTMKVSAASGQPVDMATDTARIDFTEKARLGIEYFRSHADFDNAERLQWALDLMQHDSRIALRG